VSIINLHKAPGWTPLAAMEALRAERPELVDGPMVYAGRLDPMAEGVLLVLTGEDRFALPEHLRHDKTYVATFVLGVRSDTHDALGIVESMGRGALPPATPPVASPDLLGRVAELAGTHTLPLPAWSAYKVRGRPLHAWAAEGRLAEIRVPRRDMVVHAVRDVTGGALAPAEILAEVAGRVAVVRGSFRQEAVIAAWEAALRGHAAPLVTVTATLDVASGVYVRALAEHLGATVGVGALLLRLVRTRVASWTLADATRLGGASGGVG
jgi:tRNA pseudouridine55 synthase